SAMAIYAPWMKTARSAHAAFNWTQNAGRCSVNVCLRASGSLGAKPRVTAHKSGDPLTLNRLYGRSSGHKLRKSQQELVDTLLPQIEVPQDGEITSQRLFGDNRPLHFEIGFGSGEHLAARADMLPDHGFIGAEPFLNGVAT